jgi:hypothetical protein
MRDPDARRTVRQLAIMYSLMALRESRGRETAKQPTSFVAWLGRRWSGLSHCLPAKLSKQEPNN